jgi:DNA-3-methyladenine glycosylase II
MIQPSIFDPKLILEHLNRDPILKKVIDRIGELAWNEKSDLFTDILETIVGQQLSNKAASTIWQRFLGLLPDQKLDAKAILSLSDEAMRSSGISNAKTRYIKAVAAAVQDEIINIEKIPTMPDEDIIQTLTQIKGIGPWTVEMLLIFSLNRPDVFSVGDLGLRKAVEQLYGIDRNNLKKIKKISQEWRPYRSWASRYLWKFLDNPVLIIDAKL